MVRRTTPARFHRPCQAVMPIDQKPEEILPVLRPVPSPVDSLAEALVTERRLIDDLIAIIRKQRSAVGDDDLQVIDDSVFATHRVLVTLSEARRSRRNLNALIGQPEDLGLGLDARRSPTTPHRGGGARSVRPRAAEFPGLGGGGTAG